VNIVYAPIMHQDRIWEYYQNDARENFRGSHGRLVYLIRELSPKSKVLNIGVGDGSFEKLALAAGHDVYSLDPSATSIEALRSAHQLGAKAQVGYSQKIPFPDASFQIVVMSEVLEHLEEQVLTQTIAEVSRVLVSGGCFIGTVPDSEDLSQNMIVCLHCGEAFHRWGHQQSFTQERLHSVLGRNFERIEIVRLKFLPKCFPTSTMKLWFVLKPILRLIRAQFFIKNVFLEHLAFSAKHR
jgi:SAM-dependent methyltransferase